MAEIINTPNCLPEEYINELLNLPEVIYAKDQINVKQSGSVYFSIDLIPTIKTALYDLFGLDFSAVNHIPMRWIKGDTHPHIDNSSRQFEKTHLLYLTDSPGELVIDGASYPIHKGCAYSFAEGLRHETVNTGSEPRLLLGPMSEEGVAVGAATIIQADGQTDTIYFKYFDGTGVQYKINDGDYNGFSLPVTIQNTNSDTQYPLKVLFENDLILGSSNWYFICGSDNIQFGSTSLNPDGSRPIITIDVDNYDGLIQNGDEVTPGFSSIYIYNLDIRVTPGYTTQIGAGWIGKKGFGNSAQYNYIVNCSSNGDLSSDGAVGSGGIVGAYAGKGNGTSNSSGLYLRGCSSSGNIGENCGGIAGSYAGSNGGRIVCLQCWSTNIIGQNGGGIFGNYAADTNGYIDINNCYSNGNIGVNGGGIFGANSGNNESIVVTNYCYSRGNIGTDGGGIFGANTGLNFGNTIANNSYSSGIIATSGNGIYGTNAESDNVTYCYAANNSWNDSDANSSLRGTPNPIVGEIWVSTALNQPYELNNMGYTPYSLTIISIFQQLVQLYSQTISAGGSTVQAIVPNKSYEILAIEQDGSFILVPSITINSNTGAISTTSDLELGTYYLYIRNTGSYNITQFELTVNEAPAPTPQEEQVAEEACICSQKPCAQLSYVGVTQSDKITNIHDNRVIATSFTLNNIPDNVRGRQFSSFADYMRYQQAQLKYY